jgi:hypothetical protein
LAADSESFGRPPAQPWLRRTLHLVQPASNRLLEDIRLVEEIVAIRNPPAQSHWYNSPGVIALLTFLLTSMLGVLTQQMSQQSEEVIALRRIRLELAQAHISRLADLVFRLPLGG